MSEVRIIIDGDPMPTTQIAKYLNSMFGMRGDNREAIIIGEDIVIKASGYKGLYNKRGGKK